MENRECTVSKARKYPWGENNNTLKNNGYDLANNYGYGKEFFQTLNMLITMFVFKSLDKILEFVIIQRTDGKKANDMGEYLVL